MNEQVDARGLACPQPVILTKKALDRIEEGEVLAIVDDKTARDNIITLANNSDFGINVEQQESDYYIRISKKPVESYREEITTGNIVVLISANTFGKGNDELGQVLMKSFLYALLENEEKPKSILFVNSGVKLACEGSDALEHLIALEKNGVEILCCGLCLDFYKLKEKLCVGQVTNMYAIVEKMTNADKVINL